MLRALQEREAATAALEGAAPASHRPARFHAAALGDAGLAGRLAQTAALRGHSGAVNALAWTEGGELLASGGEDCRLRLWRGATGELLHSADTVGGSSSCPVLSLQSVLLWGQASPSHRVRVAPPSLFPPPAPPAAARRRATPRTSWAPPSCPAPRETSSSPAPRTARWAACDAARLHCGISGVHSAWGRCSSPGGRRAANPRLQRLSLCCLPPLPTENRSATWR